MTPAVNVRMRLSRDIAIFNGLDYGQICFCWLITEEEILSSSNKLLAKNYLGFIKVSGKERLSSNASSGAGDDGGVTNFSSSTAASSSQDRHDSSILDGSSSAHKKKYENFQQISEITMGEI